VTLKWRRNYTDREGCDNKADSFLEFVTAMSGIWCLSNLQAYCTPCSYVCNNLSCL